MCHNEKYEQSSFATAAGAGAAQQPAETGDHLGVHRHGGFLRPRGSAGGDFHAPALRPHHRRGLPARQRDAIRGVGGGGGLGEGREHPVSRLLRGQLWSAGTRAHAAGAGGADGLILPGWVLYRAGGAAHRSRRSAQEAQHQPLSAVPLARTDGTESAIGSFTPELDFIPIARAAAPRRPAAAVGRVAVLASAELQCARAGRDGKGVLDRTGEVQG